MKYLVIAVLVSFTAYLVPKTTVTEPTVPIVYAREETAQNIKKTTSESQPLKQSAKQSAKKSAKQVDPKGCEPEQYWDENPPHNCIDKPITVELTPVSARHTGGNCEAYRHLIEQYDWDVATMMYAMQAESGCNPNAVGDNYVIGGIYAPSCGLLQVRTISPSRGTCEQLKVPEFNVQKAYEIWLSQGYGAWTTLH
jgi:hypothetical protein